jgi:septum formation protein
VADELTRERANAWFSMTQQPRIILASGSPRRKELLAEAGYQFEVIVPSEAAECGVCSAESPPELVARLAYQKAVDVGPRIGSGVILACDTVAECHGQILGKPANEEHARQMLQLLSGEEHRVYSGLCVWDYPAGEPDVRIDETRLRMDELSEQQIAEYLASDLWIGKAGAFGYQDGHDWVQVIEGSESNVVGLPMQLLARMLSDLNLKATNQD